MLHVVMGVLILKRMFKKSGKSRKRDKMVVSTGDEMSPTHRIQAGRELEEPRSVP